LSFHTTDIFSTKAFSNPTVDMSIPSYGAMPLSKTFCLVRIMQIIAMIIIIGVAANLISLINSTGVEAPREFVGALSVVCTA
jgi:hypothetical protein